MGHKSVRSFKKSLKMPLHESRSLRMTFESFIVLAGFGNNSYAFIENPQKGEKISCTVAKYSNVSVALSK